MYLHSKTQSVYQSERTNVRFVTVCTFMRSVDRLNWTAGVYTTQNGGGGR